MNFNQTSHQLALAMLVMTALYTMVYAGLTGLLLCSSVAMLIAAFVEPFELVVAGSILFTLFYIFYLKKYLRRYEPFQNPQTDAITGLISNMSKGSKTVSGYANHEPTGVLSGNVEGFENLQPDVPTDGAAAESTSAPTAHTVNQVNEKQAKDVTQAIAEGYTAEEVSEDQDMQSATGALFKNGKLPSESEEGPRMDVAKTLQKTVSQFDPEIINSMTGDTQQLIQTQQSLMGMLGQIRPILSEGNQLLQNFQNMFPSGQGFDPMKMLGQFTNAKAAPAK